MKAKYIILFEYSLGNKVPYLRHNTNGSRNNNGSSNFIDMIAKKELIIYIYAQVFNAFFYF